MAVLFRAVISTALLLLVTACSQPATPALTDSTGQTLNTDGKWLLVNYWASWCKPCRAEVPALNQLHQELSDQQVLILGYNFDRLEGEALETAARELGIEFPLLDNKSLQQLDLPGVAGIPVTFLIDPQGEYSMRLHGEQSREDFLAALDAQGAIK